MNELFEHQKTGIVFLKEKGKAILADEMGLGKSRQAIVATAEAGAAGALVVCPASLKVNWKREILGVYPDAEVQVIEAGKMPSVVISVTAPSAGFTLKRSWYVINYDILERNLAWIESMAQHGLIDTLILDEAHYIKGKSLRAAAVVGGTFAPKGKKRMKIEGIAGKMKRVYCLTGSPILNRPIELFNLLKAIGHPLAANRSYYATRYCGAYLKTIMRRGLPPLRYVDESGATNLPELRVHIAGVMLRRKKKDVLDLPEKIVSIMPVEMTDEWRKAYDTAWDKYIEVLQALPAEGEEAEEEKRKKFDNAQAARQLVETTKFKQVCSLAKVDRMIADIRNAVEQGEKIIVFSQYTETIKTLAVQLREAKIKCVTLTGADDMGERQKAVDSFQRDEETKVFIANIQAGGVGLTLTAATIVMFADMVWSPEIHAQAEDRAHRIGQEGTVNVYYYVCEETAEDDIIEILNAKKADILQILEGTKKRVKSESMQEAWMKRVAEKVADRGRVGKKV